MPGSAWLTTHLFPLVASILVTARLTGLVLRRLGQTRVVAEMLAGVMLGLSRSSGWSRRASSSTSFQSPCG